MCSSQAASARFLLRWVSFPQFQTWRTSQLTSSLLDHHAEFLAKHPRVGFRQVHGGLDAHCFQMSLYALANAPDFADVGVAQRPVVAIAALGVVDLISKA